LFCLCLPFNFIYSYSLNTNADIIRDYWHVDISKKNHVSVSCHMS
jgi:hypothetical protein